MRITEMLLRRIVRSEIDKTIKENAAKRGKKSTFEEKLIYQLAMGASHIADLDEPWRSEELEQEIDEENVFAAAEDLARLHLGLYREDDMTEEELDEIERVIDQKIKEMGGIEGIREKVAQRITKPGLDVPYEPGPIEFVEDPESADVLQVMSYEDLVQKSKRLKGNPRTMTKPEGMSNPKFMEMIKSEMQDAKRRGFSVFEFGLYVDRTSGKVSGYYIYD